MMSRSWCVQKQLRNLLGYRTTLHGFTRQIFSKTGVWPKLGGRTRQARKEAETYWKSKLKETYAVKPRHAEGQKKYYVLSMFPYPSGKLHMGHVRVYTISDVMARYHRLLGDHVIHPMGWDAFGLPAENAAIERGELPDHWTYSNIEHMRKQLDDLGCDFDWDREFATCDSSYYKWTQYIFLKMHEAGLVYQKEAPVNWDPVDQTVLADEQIDENGCSWRSGVKVETKLLRQWYIKTTAFSQALVEGLDELDTKKSYGWRSIVEMQRAWLGECDGCSVQFTVTKNGAPVDYPLSVFTRTPEALYGASHIAVSPDHPLSSMSSSLGNKLEKDKDYILEYEAVHPLTGKSLPIYVRQTQQFGEFLDAHVGIPDSNEDDRGFAAARNLPYTDVINNNNSLQNSQNLDGMNKEDAFKAVTKQLKELNCGGDIISEKRRDWLISRQRYWGTPIPIVHCPKYGPVPVAYEELPVMLPKIANFSGKGTTLESAEEWRKVKCSRCDCGGHGLRETDTMDTFVDSSWYFLRYLDPRNETQPFSPDVVQDSMPVDLYIGGIEHAILHLYFARFFMHFLHSQGLVACKEPFKNLLTQGMVLGESYRVKETGQYLPRDKVTLSDSGPIETSTGASIETQWEKMSKSKYNGIDPEIVMGEYGSDSTRLCILHQVPPKNPRKWSSDAFVGVERWETRLWELVGNFIEVNIHQENQTLSETEYIKQENELKECRNYFIREVTMYMDSEFQLNMALRRLKGFTDHLQAVPAALVQSSPIYEHALADLVVMMSPFTPCLASEMWAGLSSIAGKTQHCKWDRDVLEQLWPVAESHNQSLLQVQINGEFAFTTQLPRTSSELDSMNRKDLIQIMARHELYDKSLAGREVDHTQFSKSAYKFSLNLFTKDLSKQKIKQIKKQLLSKARNK